MKKLNYVFYFLLSIIFTFSTLLSVRRDLCFASTSEFETSWGFPKTFVFDNETNIINKIDLKDKTSFINFTFNLLFFYITFIVLDILYNKLNFKYYKNQLFILLAGFLNGLYFIFGSADIFGKCGFTARAYSSSEKKEVLIYIVIIIFISI